MLGEKIKNFKKREVLIVLLAIGAMFSTAIYSLQRIEQTQLDLIRGGLELVRDEVHESYRLWLDKREYQMKVLSNDPDLVALSRRLVNEGIPEDRTISATLVNLRNRLRPTLSANRDLGFFVIDRNYISMGSLRDSNLWTPNLIAARRSEMLDRVFEGESKFIPTIISDVPLGEEMPARLSPTLFLAAPLKDEHGNVFAVFTLRLDYLDEFNSITKRGTVGRTGETYAFDSEGVMISESRFREELAKMKLLQDRESTAARLRLADPGRNLEHSSLTPKEQLKLRERPLTYMAQQAIRGKAGFSVDAYPGYRGVPVVGAWLWDNEFSIGIATEMDKNEAYDIYYFVRNIWLAVIAVTVVIMVSLATMLINLRYRTERALAIRQDRLEETNRKLVMARNDAEQAIRMKKHFLNTMSHELKTPLNIITGNIFQMETLSHGAQFRKYLNRISAAARNLHRIVEHIFQIITLELDDDESSSRPFDLRNVLNEVRGVYEQACQKKSLEFDFQVSPDVPGQVTGNPDMLRTVLYQLLDNSVKFTSEGKVSLHVNQLGDEPGRAKLSFCVIDTGKGMNEDEIETGFQLFSQLAESTVRSTDGIGVGLPLCQKLVNRMQGTLQVESQPGEGSHFSALIPFRVDSLPVENSIEVNNELKGEARSEPEGPMPASYAPQRIDSDIMRKQLSMLQTALDNDDFDAKRLMQEFMALVSRGTGMWEAANAMQRAVDAFDFDLASQHLLSVSEMIDSYSESEMR